MNVKSLLLVSALLLPCTPLFAANTTNIESIPDEIIVTGQRTMRGMRDSIDKAQDQVFALFNELNETDAFDIHCQSETRAGTRIRFRTCMPEFYSDARTDEAQAIITGIAVPPLSSVAGYYYPLMMQEMRATMAEHPELAASLVEYVNRMQEYDDFRTQYFEKD